FLAGLLESRICLSSLQLPSTIMGKPPHSLVLFGQTLSQRTSCQTCQRRCHQCRARCRRLQLPPPARVVEVFVAQNPNRARPSGPVQISMKPRSSRTTAPAHSAIIEIKDNAIEISGPIETGDFEKFVEIIANYPHSKIVSLNSRGGMAKDAVEIGLFI